MESLADHIYTQIGTSLFCLFYLIYQIRDWRKTEKLWNEMDAKYNRLADPMNLFIRYRFLRMKRGHKARVSIWRRIYIRRKAVGKLLTSS